MSGLGELTPGVWDKTMHLSLYIAHSLLTAPETSLKQRLSERYADKKRASQGVIPARPDEKGEGVVANRDRPSPAGHRRG